VLIMVGKEAVRRQGRLELRTGAVGSQAFYTCNDRAAMLPKPANESTVRGDTAADQ
jgi:hypothetical protein